MSRVEEVVFGVSWSAVSADQRLAHALRVASRSDAGRAT
jgi:hypothetical protein